MRILYLANVRMPTEKAHGIQIMNMCAVLGEAHEVTLAVPWRFNAIRKNPYDYYGIPKTFQVVRLPSLDATALGPVGFWIRTITFSVSAFFYAIMYRPDIVYGRDELSLLAVSFAVERVYFEGHDGRMNAIVRELFKHLSGLIVITRGLSDFYTREGYTTLPIHIAPDGVSVERFTNLPSQSACRTTLGLPLDRPIALYSGHLYDWKGAAVLAQAAVHIPHVLVVFVGGTDADIKKFRRTFGHIENIRIFGRKPHAEVPQYLKAADVLILPNVATTLGGVFTSPLKLFEYMASGVPIIASDVPALREVLDDTLAFFTPPNDVERLAKAIGTVLAEHEAAGTRARSARAQVEQYTWSARRSGIQDFFEKTRARARFIPSTGRKAALYIIGGGTAAVVNLSLLFLLTDIVGLWYLVSTSLAFIVAFFVSFIMQKYLTFADRTNHALTTQLGNYFFVAMVNIVLNGLMMFVWVDILHVHYLLAQIIVSITIAVWSFFIYQHLIFKRVHHA